MAEPQRIPSSCAVAPREGRVSRNDLSDTGDQQTIVAPREGRVSRNMAESIGATIKLVAPREGRVSRNHCIPAWHTM